MTRLSFRTRLMIGFALINLLMATIVAISLRASREQATERTVMVLGGLTQVLERSISGMIQRIDLTLLDIAEELEETSLRRTDEPAMRQLLRRHYRHHATIDVLVVADATGRIAFTSGVASEKPVSIADRSYFATLRDNANAGLVLSKPVTGRLTGSRVLIFARRINTPEGRFAGAVFASVRTARFAEMFQSLDLGTEGVASFTDLDLNLIARQPEPPWAGATSGTRILSEAFSQAQKRHPGAGAFRTVGVLDQVDRMMSYRRLEHYPGYLFLGIGTADMLAEWRKEAATMAVLMAVVILATAMASCLLHLGWQRQASATAALDALNKRLLLHARTDALTGCANRRHFLEVLEGERQRALRYDTDFCVLALDLDFFKAVNDRHGHQGGDQVLCCFASVVGNMLRPTDLLGRMGGEEFEILLPETTLPAAAIMAERIRQAVSATRLPLADGQAAMTVSIGVAQWDRDGPDTSETLLRRADTALYAAKGGGRNQVWSDVRLSPVL